MKYIAPIVVAIFSFNFCETAVRAAEVSKNLSEEFKMEHRTLVEAMEKAEDVCGAPQAFSREDMITFVNDATWKSLYRMQGGKILGTVSRAPFHLVKALSAAGHYLNDKKNEWISTEPAPEDPGQMALDALTQMIDGIRSRRNLSDFESVCLSACVTRVMVKYSLSPAGLKTVFAPAQKVVCNQKGLCVDIAAVFEHFTNRLNIPTYTFSDSAGRVLASALVGACVTQPTNYWSIGVPPTLHEVAGFFAIVSSEMLVGHYLTQIRIGGEDYVFDPLFDYSTKNYSCTFHK